MAFKKRKATFTVDGRDVGPVKDGERLEVSVEPGLHTVTQDWERKWYLDNKLPEPASVQVEVADGATRTVHLQPRTEGVYYDSVNLSWELTVE